MKRQQQNLEERLRRHLTHFGSPSSEQCHDSEARILARLSMREATAWSRAEIIQDRGRPSPKYWQRALLAVAALLVAVIAPALLFERNLPLASIESGAAARNGNHFQTAGSTGTLIVLADGSRVEMRERSEMAVERASDGLRIRLNQGSIIVSAAKQQRGHLYVQTSDVTVTVVGTVFVVNAEQAGSSVSVIEGKVQFRQGPSEKTLLPGDHVATNREMESRLVTQEISWSPNVSAHLAMLQAAAIPAAVAQNAAGNHDRFEVASLRPAPDATAGGRGGGPGSKCSGIPRMDPAQLNISRVTLYQLIALAYGKSCLYITAHDLIAGAPAWGESDRFDLQANLPSGVPVYRTLQLINGDAPRLQGMLQELLAERFKLVVHRETRELSVYALNVVKGGAKLQPFEEGSCNPTPPPPPVPPGAKPPCSYVIGVSLNRPGFHIVANGVTLDSFARLLSLTLDRPMVDQTGISGVFDIALDASSEGTTLPPPLFPERGAEPGGIASPSSPSLFSAIQSQLGLKLDATRAPVEVLVIDRVERLTEN